MSTKTLLLSFAILVLLLAGCGGGSRELNPAGTLEATEVDIAATMAGRIREVRPRLGDRVAVGDTLVILDTELLALQREQSETSRVSIAAQKQVAMDNLAQAERNLELAETTLVRTEAVAGSGSATQQQLDEVLTRRDVLALQVQTARHQIRALEAEEEKLNAALAVFDRQLRDGLILAPSSGTIILRSAEPGETAAPGSVLLRLADLDHLELRVFLAETDLDRVKVGQQLPVVADALPTDTLRGTVTWISPEAEFTPKNAQTRQARTQLVYAVKLSVSNSDGRLHIGMPAEVVL